MSSQAKPSTSQQEQTAPNENPYTMTEEILRKKYDQTDSGRFITQFSVAIVASISAFSFGSLMEWSRIDMTFLRSYPKCYQELWSISLMPLGCSLAFTPSHYIIKNLGPKKTMIFVTPFYMLSFFMVIDTSIQISLKAAHFLTGFLGVIYLVSSENLLAGAVHRKNLVYVLISMRLFISIGLLVSFISTRELSASQSSIFCCSIPLINMLFAAMLPESPYFLYNTNKQKAFHALQWYRGQRNVYTALHYLESDVKEQQTLSENNKIILFSKSVIKAIALVTITNFFKVFSGYFVFLLYDISRNEPRVTVISSYVDTIFYLTVIIVVNCFVYITRSFINFGVRKPLILSSIVVTIALMVETTYLYSLHRNYVDESLSRKYGIQLIVTSSLVIGYSFGYETCPDILLREYLPYQVRLIAKGLTRTTYWLFIYLLLLFYVSTSSCQKQYVAFLSLSIISSIGIVFFYVFIIESKDKNLMLLQMLMGGNPVGSRGGFRGRLDVTAFENAL
ncbi:hypothetical protein FQR65_LT06065 [Abscondita terminalis]|nr:hypothetical protein FQR65_LT06065 [Abscondita terminalis]